MTWLLIHRQLTTDESNPFHKSLRKSDLPSHTIQDTFMGQIEQAKNMLVTGTTEYK